MDRQTLRPPSSLLLLLDGMGKNLDRTGLTRFGILGDHEFHGGELDGKDRVQNLQQTNHITGQ